MHPAIDRTGFPTALPGPLDVRLIWGRTPNTMVRGKHEGEFLALGLVFGVAMHNIAVGMPPYRRFRFCRSIHKKSRTSTKHNRAGRITRGEMKRSSALAMPLSITLRSYHLCVRNVERERKSASWNEDEPHLEPKGQPRSLRPTLHGCVRKKIRQCLHRARHGTFEKVMPSASSHK